MVKHGESNRLNKKAKIVLDKKKLVEVKAEIVVAIDRSGSMYRLYSDGTVQNLVERLLGIGMNMDANKEIDVFQFNQGSKYIGVATEENHANFVRDKKMSADGGTNYAPVMKEIIAKYSGTEKKEDSAACLVRKVQRLSNQLIRRSCSLLQTETILTKKRQNV